MFRENNNIIGIDACRLGRPPVIVKYLVDEYQPAEDVKISADGLTYTVSDGFHLILLEDGCYLTKFIHSFI